MRNEMDDDDGRDEEPEPGFVLIVSGPVSWKRALGCPLVKKLGQGRRGPRRKK